MNVSKRFALLAGLAFGAVTAILLVALGLFVVVRGMMSGTPRPQRWHPITPTPTPVASPTSSAISATPEPASLHVGGQAKVVAKVGVRMRKTPGYRSKPATDIVTVVPPESVVQLTGGPEFVDGLRWWRVRYNDKEGWMAESTASGVQLLVPLPSGR